MAFLVPLGALVDPRLALEPAAVRLGDVVVARGEDVEDEATVRRRGVRAPRAARRGGRRRSACAGASGTGSSRAAKRSSTGGSRRSPKRRSSSTPARAAASRATSSIPSEESTPTTRSPASAIGTAIRPGPDPELEHGPARAHRLGDVELDVLDDAHRPGVVEPGDLVVDRHAGMLPPTMDWQEYEAQATRAIGDAATIAALEDVRVAVPRSQERARACAARGARPRDRDAPERDPRTAGSRRSTSGSGGSPTRSSTAGCATR